MRGQRLADSGMVDLTPGDYRRQSETVKGEKAGETREVQAWYVRPPRGPVQRLAAELVTEHEDGTISIPAVGNEEGAWSLVAGDWQSPSSPAEERETKETRGRRKGA